MNFYTTSFSPYTPPVTRKFGQAEPQKKTPSFNFPPYTPPVTRKFRMTEPQTRPLSFGMAQAKEVNSIDDYFSQICKQRGLTPTQVAEVVNVIAHTDLRDKNVRVGIQFLVKASWKAAMENPKYPFFRHWKIGKAVQERLKQQGLPPDAVVWSRPHPIDEFVLKMNKRGYLTSAEVEVAAKVISRTDLRQRDVLEKIQQLARDSWWAAANGKYDLTSHWELAEAIQKRLEKLGMPPDAVVWSRPHPIDEFVLKMKKRGLTSAEVKVAASVIKKADLRQRDVSGTLFVFMMESWFADKEGKLDFARHQELGEALQGRLKELRMTWSDFMEFAKPD